MPALLLYLLQVNAGFTIVYLLYQLVLRQTTFYTLNRLFMVMGVVLSALLPLCDFADWFPGNPKVYQTLSTLAPAWNLPVTDSDSEPAFNLWLVPLSIFWLGVGIMMLRVLIQGFSLYALHRHSPKASYSGIRFRRLQATVPPFSFWQTIYFNPQQHKEQNWLPILQHEQTHVKQWHTLDILLIEVSSLFHWFNPVVWLLRKALKQNLEFLTDQQTLEVGINRKQYQYSLLQTAGVSPFSLTSSFSYHSLKNRISMMNKAPSARVQQWRILAATPLLFLSLLACQTIGDPSPQSMIESNGTAQRNFLDPEEQYKAFRLHYQSVTRLSWDKDSLVLDLISGEKEKHPLTPQGIAAVEKKYGKWFTPKALKTQQVPPPPPPFYAAPEEFVKRNPTVKGMSNDREYFYLLFKSGKTEKFPATPEGRAAFEKKYGTLPPPPPPVKELPPPPPPSKKNLLLLDQS